MTDVDMIDGGSEVGSRDYRAYIGPTSRYDFMGASQFRLATTLGLRSGHKLLDFGCGSLRAGKLFIPYLETGNYFAVEPNRWLVEEGIANELSAGLVDLKCPSFSHNDDFCVPFTQLFDFAIAQSIFSHTDKATTVRGLKNIAEALTDSGILLATFIEDEDYSGPESWVYPGITTFTKATIKSMTSAAGLHSCRVPWFHPAQTWYLLSKSKASLPSWFAAQSLLGGEELMSKQYSQQSFFANRVRSWKIGATALRLFVRRLRQRNN
jgi:SAM-dependent methyltransferase